ncbi:hypothetical protein Clacol_008674 [Clathrus columnatus]|uniref:Peptidase S53 domain-containing protein n=1 Tax=Clathrus columnatus TaxID=1419009 RepID=A0AAV5ARA5_9AGAM|nr:hypothetical protein Clacol_008674 [Clathrus columnatus]
MGVSIFAASGDGGVESNLGPGFCISNDGSNRTTFIPTFPASCSLLTHLFTGIHKASPRLERLQFGPEVAVKSFGSGGGFSNYGYPDIAAQGDNFQTIVSGESFINGGTSASTPTVAGLVALLNDARLAAGKPTLGFLNPLLYSVAAEGFNDIIEGNNPGCGTQGFSCAAGWDPGITSTAISEAQAGPLRRRDNASGNDTSRIDPELASFYSQSNTFSSVPPVAISKNTSGQLLFPPFVIPVNTKLNIDTTQLRDSDNCKSDAPSLSCQVMALQDISSFQTVSVAVFPLNECQVSIPGTNNIYVTSDDTPLPTDLAGRVSMPIDTICAGSTYVYAYESITSELGSAADEE